MSNFRITITIEATVVTQQDKTVQWVEDNVLDDFHQELVQAGYIVGDMQVEQVESFEEVKS
jgi:hypothetical protein